MNQILKSSWNTFSGKKLDQNAFLLASKNVDWVKLQFKIDQYWSYPFVNLISNFSLILVSSAMS